MIFFQVNSLIFLDRYPLNNLSNIGKRKMNDMRDFLYILIFFIESDH